MRMVFLARFAIFIACLFLFVASVQAADSASAQADAGVVVAPATSQPATVDDAVDTSTHIFAAFRRGDVRAGIAGCIMLLVFLWRRFASGFLLDKVPSKYLPFVTAGVAFLAAIPPMLTVPAWSWTTFVWQGLITSAQAMALWSLLGKHILARWLPERK